MNNTTQKNKIISKLGGNWINNVLALLALLFTFFVYVKTCTNDSNIRDLETRINAVTFQPRLKPISNISVAISLDSFKTDMPISDAVGTSMMLDTMELQIDADLTVNLEVDFVNVREALAKYVGEIWTDTNYEGAKIREILDDLNNWKHRFRIDSISKCREALEHDTISVHVEKKITDIDSNRFVIHLLVLYRNELGDLYDTYVWFPIELNEFIMRPAILERDENESIVLALEKPITVNHDYNVSYRTYNRKESKNILSGFSKIIDH